MTADEWKNLVREFLAADDWIDVCWDDDADVETNKAVMDEAFETLDYFRKRLREEAWRD